ncbi:MAG TPA: hypothetical protein DDY57_09170, partial [Franconibacter pulveris]|nr:hypothetical protein [Franconibacter pulveris]
MIGLAHLLQWDKTVAHLLIVDALNLIRRIHAVQGSPCVEACLHALDLLILQSQTTNAVAVFDVEERSNGWPEQMLHDDQAGHTPMPEAEQADMGGNRKEIATLQV